MVVRKLSVSVSGELESALRRLAADRDEDLSPLVEVLLREHWLVARRIQEARDAHGEDVSLLGDAARKIWSERASTGELQRGDEDPKSA